MFKKCINTTPILYFRISAKKLATGEERTLLSSQEVTMVTEPEPTFHAPVDTSLRKPVCRMYTYPNYGRGRDRPLGSN